MDAAPANLRLNANDAGEGAGGNGRKDKGKGKMTEAQEEDKEREREETACKALKQCREEVMSWSSEVLAVEMVQALSEMEALNTVDPRFARGFTPEPVDTHWSPTPSGLVRDEEDPSERDRMAVYSEDEDREGALQ
jgi:hypothetical protein